MRGCVVIEVALRCLLGVFALAFVGAFAALAVAVTSGLLWPAVVVAVVAATAAVLSVALMALDSFVL